MEHSTQTDLSLFTGLNVNNVKQDATQDTQHDKSSILDLGAPQPDEELITEADMDISDNDIIFDIPRDPHRGITQCTPELELVEDKKLTYGRYQQVVYSKDSANYYMIPELELLIPDCAQADQLLLQACVDMGNIKMSQDLIDYPIVNHKHAVTLFKHYKVLAVLRKMTVTKPIKLFSGYDQAIMEARRRAQADQQKEANRARREAIDSARTSVTDLSSIIGGM